MGDERREIWPDDRGERLYRRLTSFFDSSNTPLRLFTALEVPQRNALMAWAFELATRMLKHPSRTEEDRNGEERIFDALICQFICGFESGYF